MVMPVGYAHQAAMTGRCGAARRRACRSRGRRGFTVLFAGLSGASKSALATALAAMLREAGERPVALLDGNAARRRLSDDPGLSREDRETHLRHVGCVAAGVMRRGGIAICALIAPYAAARREMRERIEAVGASRCMSRPRSGPARRATPRGSTPGRAPASSRASPASTIPVRRPRSPDSAVDTSGLPPEVAARGVLAELERLGLIR